jgi:hypothetical protein
MMSIAVFLCDAPLILQHNELDFSCFIPKSRHLFIAAVTLSPGHGIESQLEALQQKERWTKNLETLSE